MVAMPTRAPIHVGETLADALRDRNTTRYVLAKRTGLSQTAIGDIVEGRRGVTAKTALLLGRFFGTSPDFWLNLQNAYDLDVAREALGERLDAVEPLGGLEEG